LPLDHIAFTERFAAMEEAVSDALRKLTGIKGKELLTIGTIDPKARQFLEKRGWKIKERFAKAALQGIMTKSMME